MAHIHEIKDAETHFIIDATTREISNAGALPALGQKDHNSEIFTFVAPRYVDNHDLSICNKVRVHYLNIESDTRKVYADIYEVADLHIDEADTTKVVFTWLISNYSTQLAGLLNFAIEFSCEKDGVIDYSWNTAIFTGIVVKKGINNAAQIITEYTDILEKWKQDVIKELAQNGNSHDHDNKNTLDAFGCQALDNPITDGDFNFGINTEDWHRLKFQGDTILTASDGAVVRNVEVKEDDNGNKFFRMYFNKPGLDTGLVPFTSFVDIPINGTNDKFDFGLNGSGLELELPAGGTGGLTPEQLADLEANTAARHEHENKDLLDGFDIKNNEDKHIYYRNRYVWTAGAGSVIARVETTTSGDLNITLATNYRETETLTIKAPPTKLSQLENDSEYATAEYIDNALADINTRIDEIAGGFDEIETMIDEIETLINESGVLDDES